MVAQAPEQTHSPPPSVRTVPSSTPLPDFSTVIGRYLAPLPTDEAELRVVVEQQQQLQQQQHVQTPTSQDQPLNVRNFCAM